MKSGIGIDYSMTCPAACIYGEPDIFFWFAHATKYKVTLPNVATTQVVQPTHTIQRSRDLAYACCVWLDSVTDKSDTRIFIEDYAYAATGKVFHIGENTGVLKSFVHAITPFEIVPVPPTVIKKFATGKGNADKFKMTSAFLEAYPAARTWLPALFPRLDEAVPAISPLADLADAYWIARYAAEIA